MSRFTPLKCYKIYSFLQITDLLDFQVVKDATPSFRLLSSNVRYLQVVKNACTTIGGIIYADEECGLQILGDPNSIPTILEAFKRHDQQPEVGFRVCSFFVLLKRKERC